eukprot:NODE_3208_length_1258_cov_53.831718_g3045_i0.p1 GENE.NODE_3208_length_1258_cov_53.831718_g3045_i0~~NODE_3208_length_1258_cov_53.831718_g3045_i0.p1  ORF type:complete len:362 (+),score=84.36 NODE_3208_length_1258_cov_53.831718_g3045_i0:55-1086(+)
MAMPTFLLAMVCFGLCSGASLPFSTNPSTLVADVNETTFMETVYSSDSVWTVMFYNSSQAASKKAAANWESVASGVSAYLSVGGFEVTETSKWISDAMKLKDLPVVMSFPSRLSGTKENPPKPAAYRGDLNVTSLTRWALRQLPSKWVYRHKTQAEIKQYHNDTIKYPKALMFHNDSDCPALLRSLSLEFTDSLLMTEVRCKTNKLLEVAKKYGVNSLPGLVVMPANETTPVPYDGDLVPGDTREFLKEHALDQEARDQLRRERDAETAAEEAAKQKRLEQERLEREAIRKKAAEEKKRIRREKNRILKERDANYKSEENKFEAMDGEQIQIRDEGWDVVDVA